MGGWGGGAGAGVQRAGKECRAGQWKGEGDGEPRGSIPEGSSRVATLHDGLAMVGFYLFARNIVCACHLSASPPKPPPPPLPPPPSSSPSPALFVLGLTLPVTAPVSLSLSHTHTLNLSLFISLVVVLSELLSGSSLYLPHSLPNKNFINQPQEHSPLSSLFPAQDPIPLSEYKLHERPSMSARIKKL